MSKAAAIHAIAPPRSRPALDADDWVVRVALVIFGAYFLVALVVPLFMMVSRSVQNIRGEFVGLDNYILYFQTPALSQSINNSFFVAGLSTVIVIVLAFIYAYALTRTRMPFKWFFRVIVFVPLLSPSLLKAIALVYWFGNQGVLKEIMMGHSIYGPIGIVIASVFWTFPHAFLIISTALALSDGRLYEAAEALKTSRMRVFFTVTLPGVRYGLIGQQNFEMGAVVCMILLIPAVFAFAIDRIATRKQVALLSARAVPYEPKPNRWADMSMLVYCSIMTVLILAVIGMAQYASLVKLWPYNLSLTLEHFRFDFEGFGWSNFYNSLILAASTAVIGTGLIFIGAYLVEKPRSAFFGRQIVQFLAMLPLTVPGLVLGLSYIFFFNHPANPFGFMYATMAILVMSTVTHFYTVSHLTAVTALKQMDREFESVSASLKVPLRRSFFKVTVPVCMPAILDISIYLFLNAMTTVSAVIFLYSPTTKVASVAAIHMDELGEVASAAAMAMLIVYACLTVRLLHLLVTRGLLRRLQAWRTR
jgi:iron(III) transport system permease protein